MTLYAAGVGGRGLPATTCTSSHPYHGGINFFPPGDFSLLNVPFMSGFGTIMMHPKTPSRLTPSILQYKASANDVYRKYRKYRGMASTNCQLSGPPVRSSQATDAKNGKAYHQYRVLASDGGTEDCQKHASPRRHAFLAPGCVICLGSVGCWPLTSGPKTARSMHLLHAMPILLLAASFVWVR